MAEPQFDVPLVGRVPVHELPDESRLPRLRLQHLFALTVVMAVLLAIGGPRRDSAAQDSPTLLISIWMLVSVVQQILASIAVTVLAYGLVRYRRGQRFLDQPGHWLLVEIALITFLWIPPTLVFRSMTFSKNASPDSFPMLIMMITGLYSLLFLSLGRAVINIYLGIQKCPSGRWRYVFFAKALSAISFGLGDLLVIPLVLRSASKDRSEQLPRDTSHWCGVGVQLGMGVLSIATVVLMAYNFVWQVKWR